MTTYFVNKTTSASFSATKVKSYQFTNPNDAVAYVKLKTADPLVFLAFVVPPGDSVSPPVNIIFQACTGVDVNKEPNFDGGSTDFVEPIGIALF